VAEVTVSYTGDIKIEIQDQQWRGRHRKYPRLLDATLEGPYYRDRGKSE
jgi:hypothetical protein